MRVLTEEKRPINPLNAAVVADRPGDRQDVRLGKCAIERRAPVPAGSESDPLARIGRIGLTRVVRLFERRDIDQDVRGSKLTGQGMDRHRNVLLSVNALNRCVDLYSTGHGFAFQISLAYCEIVRSLENLPE